MDWNIDVTSKGINNPMLLNNKGKNNQSWASTIRCIVSLSIFLASKFLNAEKIYLNMQIHKSWTSLDYNLQDVQSLSHVTVAESYKCLQATLSYIKPIKRIIIGYLSTFIHFGNKTIARLTHVNRYKSKASDLEVLNLNHNTSIRCFLFT